MGAHAFFECAFIRLIVHDVLFIIFKLRFLFNFKSKIHFHINPEIG